MPETGYLLCQWLQIGYRFSFIKNTLRGLPRPDALRPACPGLYSYDDKAKAAQKLCWAARSGLHGVSNGWGGETRRQNRKSVTDTLTDLQQKDILLL